MTEWKALLAAFAPLLLAGCEQGKAPLVHADAAAAPVAPSPSASAIEVEAGPAPSALPPAASCELRPDERAELQKCLWGLVAHLVGIRGTFPLRVKLSVEAGKARASYQIDYRAWRDAPEGSCLVALAQRLAGDAGASLSCAYAATGPYPKWTLEADRLSDAGH